ncbi:MAG: 16S rRNA (cytosine(1402)-N(4))-methyltransferase RsmH [Chthonomonadales bacterium]
MAFHLPVMARETVELLELRPGLTIVDATAGGGGHAALMAQQISPGGRLVLLDRDPQALDEATQRVSAEGVSCISIGGNFRNIGSLLSERGIYTVDRVLIDLGVSSHQLDTPERGFSFRRDAPLDMRMGPDAGPSAAELLERITERELAQLLWDYADERWAQRISRFVVRAREQEPIRTTRQLAQIVERAIPRAAWPKDIHPATRTFLALRIAVNDELNALRDGLEQVVRLLRAPGGRVAVIAYHSAEDRVVKQVLRKLSGQCQCPPRLPKCTCGAVPLLRRVTKKPVVPSEDEVATNPRSRSARLRVAERVQLGEMEASAAAS